MRVWVDCTAAAHPLVLRPIIERLRAAGHEVEVTARQYGQTEGILERLGIPYASFGSHGGASALGKGRALAGRSARLWRWARRQQLDFALAHGSVDIALVSRALRIPLVQMNDYEHAGLQRRISFRTSRLVIAPDAIPIEAMERAGARRDRLFRYPGLKEDYYLADFEPDDSILDELGLDRERVIVVVRPPPETSEYHERNPIYEAVIERIASEERASAVVIARTNEQRQRIESRYDPSLIAPDRAIDAQSLIAFADLVVSAGGTMNREAVALGTPVYTIFSGRLGAVDERLISAGKLRPLGDPAQLEITKRSSEPGVQHPRDPQLLTDAVLSVVTNS